MSKEIDRILEDNIYPIKYKSKVIVNTDNGMLNSVMIDYEKRRFMKNAVVAWVDELVKYKQEYPKNNKSKVEFNMDIVIMRRADFNKLTKAYNE